MKELNFEPSLKQFEALQLLQDSVTRFLWYWGAAWGWKTYVAVAWIVIMCSAYPWVKYWIFRRYIVDIKDSTYESCMKVLLLLWFEEWVNYKIRDNWKEILFSNWSKILFRWLQEKPSDIHFTKLWWMELTWAFVDEANECPEKWIRVLGKRVWRWMNWEYNIKAKVLCCFNPDKWWVYKWFYLPHRDWVEKADTKFIKALAKDNPYNTQDYLDSLKNETDKILYERLRLWNFEYDNTPWRLFDYDQLLDLATNPIVRWMKRISWDIAWEWDDLSVLWWFDWGYLEHFKVIAKNKIDDKFDNEFRDMARIMWIWMSKVVVDGTWIWEWVAWHLKCKKFVSAASAIQPLEQKLDKTQKADFANLRSQCYFELAKWVKNAEINLEKMPEKYLGMLVEELDVIVQIDVDKEWPRRVIPKVDIKKALWRSPDISDMLMQIMFFEFNKQEAFIIGV